MKTTIMKAYKTDHARLKKNAADKNTTLLQYLSNILNNNKCSTRLKKDEVLITIFNDYDFDTYKDYLEFDAEYLEARYDHCTDSESIIDTKTMTIRNKDREHLITAAVTLRNGDVLYHSKCLNLHSLYFEGGSKEVRLFGKEK